MDPREFAQKLIASLEHKVSADRARLFSLANDFLYEAHELGKITFAQYVRIGNELQRIF